ncbi:MAG: thioredoxin family protein [Oligosphaeraceae bacterium]
MTQRLSFVLAFLLLAGMAGLAQEPAAAAPPQREEVVIPPPVGATTPRGWFDDWNAALTASRRTNRPMLVLFTGSDWCPPCKRLKETVLNTPAFQDYARQNLILVFVDSPRSVRLPPALQQSNRMLKQTLKPGNGVPAVVLLSPAGERLDHVVGFTPDLLPRIQKALAP